MRMTAQRQAILNDLTAGAVIQISQDNERGTKTYSLLGGGHCPKQSVLENMFFRLLQESKLLAREDGLFSGTSQTYRLKKDTE